MIPKMKASLAIRKITGNAEMRAVENLQKEVWGIPDLDVVPVSQLVAATAAGGVLLGAFDVENLVGFAYGFVSYENGRTAHHSHMLAVKPEYRNFNLGERLKRAQREAVLGQGISTMSWTFDPLQSLNAYFNFNKLGVVSDQYFIDFYGADAASFLHRNSTDRLWVIWNLNDEKAAAKTDFERVKTIVKLGENNIPQILDLSETDEQVAIEIPADINKLQKQNVELAARWREATRKAFVNAFANDYVVKEFYRGKRDDLQFGAYLLNREK